MIPFADMLPVRNGQLTLIQTDLVEAEALLRSLAREEQRRRPEAFAGLEPCVYVKMPYVRPCDSFQELRRLILRVREKTGLRADFKGIVAIEATQWLGHEREEYFTVLLKYLYDHRDTWQAVMVLSRCSDAQLDRFRWACVRCITPKTVQLRLFEKPEPLMGLLREALGKRGVRISPEAAAELAKALLRPELKDARSLALVERTAEEAAACCDGQHRLSADRIRGYLREEGTTLSLLAGKTLFEERGECHENEVLQL